MTRRIEVVLDRHASLVRGYGARAMVTTVTGRPPCWIPRLSGWSCSEQTARDVLAMVETLPGVDIVVTGRTDRRRRALDALRAAPAPRELGVDR